MLVLIMDSGLANDEEKPHEQNGQSGDYCPNHQRSSSCSMRCYARRLTRTTANVPTAVARTAARTSTGLAVA